MAAALTITTGDAPGKGRNGPPLLLKAATRPVRMALVTLAWGGADTYATGGYDVSSLFELFGTAVDAIVVQGVNGFTFSPDLANKKVKVFSASGTEVANAATSLQNLSTVALVFGRG